MTYLASGLAVEGTITPLPQFSNQAVLRESNGETSLLGNTCLHRGAIILDAPQPADRPMVCPLHRWTYDQAGHLMGEPFHGAAGCLPSWPVSRWNHLLFTGRVPQVDLPADLAHLFSLDGYQHTRTEVMTVKSSWQVFMEVYLDLYHVEPFHPGLGNFVDMSNYRWHFGDDWSLQEVGLTRQLRANPDAAFREVEKRLAEDYEGVFRHGALWLTIYPNIMLEWYPHMLAVSTVWQTGNPGECLNVVEFHHTEEVSAFDPAFVEAQLKAYHTAAVEDAHICERIQQGNTFKSRQHLPTHPSLELGIRRFYEALDSRPGLTQDLWLPDHQR